MARVLSSRCTSIRWYWAGDWASYFPVMSLSAHCFPAFSEFLDALASVIGSIHASVELTASVPALHTIKRGFAASQDGPWHHRRRRAGAPDLPKRCR